MNAVTYFQFQDEVISCRLICQIANLFLLLLCIAYVDAVRWDKLCQTSKAEGPAGKYETNGAGCSRTPDYSSTHSPIPPFDVAIYTPKDIKSYKGRWTHRLQLHDEFMDLMRIKVLAVQGNSSNKTLQNH